MCCYTASGSPNELMLYVLSASECIMKFLCILLLYINTTVNKVESWTKWPTFCTQHFQRKYVFFHECSTADDLALNRQQAISWNNNSLVKWSMQASADLDILNIFHGCECGSYNTFCFGVLTHWPLGDVAMIWKVYYYLNTFYGSEHFLSNYQGEFYRSLLMVCQH